MNNNEFGVGAEKRKTRNVVIGTVSVILVLIVSIIIFLIISKYMKKDEETKGKISYEVIIKSNGADMKDITLGCYSYVESCQINLPIITRENWQIIGFSKDANGREAEYTSGEVINVSSNMTLYAITVKSVSISLVNGENETTLSCGIYNTETNCDITLPNNGKGWNEEINSQETIYLPGEKISINNYKRLYYIK